MKLQKITEKFKNEANQDKVSASYLFYGDKRVDLLSYALMFSKMIMTKNIQNDAEKGKIERLIDISQHPDIEIINKNNENIKIDEVREIIYSSIESSFNSPKKIFILCGIENLRKESSNALLKILEEPPKNVYFILLSRTLNIIPTIKSRTIKFHLSGMNNEELGVSKEIYYFFDGNENDILEFKRQNLSLDDIKFQINTVEDIFQIVTEMKNYVSGEFAVKNSLDLTIKYNKSIELIARRIRFWELENVYFFINEIEKIFDKNGVPWTGIYIFDTERTVNKKLEIINSEEETLNLKKPIEQTYDSIRDWLLPLLRKDDKIIFPKEEFLERVKLFDEAEKLRTFNVIKSAVEYDGYCVKFEEGKIIEGYEVIKAFGEMLGIAVEEETGEKVEEKEEEKNS